MKKVVRNSCSLDIVSKLEWESSAGRVLKWICSVRSTQNFVLEAFFTDFIQTFVKVLHYVTLVVR